jgi:hypothetical protein
MTILDLPPLENSKQHNMLPSAVPGFAPLLRPPEAVTGGLLQFQLRRLVDEILADPDLDPGIFDSLVRQLAEHPGNPEQALLAHLRAVQESDDLPPFKACRPSGT